MRALADQHFACAGAPLEPIASCAPGPQGIESGRAALWAIIDCRVVARVHRTRLRAKAMQRHNLPVLIFTLVLLAGAAASQNAGAPPTSSPPQGSAAPATGSAASSPGMGMAEPTPNPIDPLILRLQQTAQQTNIDLARLRIEKWKGDGNSKQQAQNMANSVVRNVSGALPEMMQQARSAPANVAPVFKLYHNVTALYETLSMLTEAAAAVGSRSEYEALEHDLTGLQDNRRALADYVQTLSAANDTELARLREQARAAAVPAAPAEPKKVIVDTDEKPVTPAKKPARSTKKKSAATPPAAAQPKAPQ